MSTRHEPGYMPWDRRSNKLLVQSSLGKSKPSCYDIPQGTFTYGKLTPEDPEKITSLLYDWHLQQKSSNPNQGKFKDMLKTNKQAIKNLMTTSSQFSGFRKDRTVFQQFLEGSNTIKIRLPEESHSYGKPLSLEDPIKLVIANNYGEADRKQRHSFYQTQSGAFQDTQLKRRLSCHITKNHQLVKKATALRLESFNWDKKKEQWKLGKFTSKATAKVDHRWKEENLSGKSEKKNNSYQASSISQVHSEVQ